MIRVVDAEIADSVRPGNILVDEMMQPKVLDFGIARMLEFNTEATRQTNIGEIIGTLAYMSPEQISADPALLEARGDLCSLGLLSCWPPAAVGA